MEERQHNRSQKVLAVVPVERKEGRQGVYAAEKDGCVTEKGDFMLVHTHGLEEVCMHAHSYLPATGV